MTRWAPEGGMDMRRGFGHQRGAALISVPLALVVTALAFGVTACTPPQAYVALGDSYTAGPVIPVQLDDPGGCLRSDHNYPHLAAPETGLAPFRDVSCSGATTDDMTQPQ